MLRWIMKVMGQGLVALIPVTLTVGIIVWLGVWLDGLLSNPLRDLFPGSTEAYRMGMGLILLLLILFLAGLMVRLWLVQKLLSWVEKAIMRLPLVKTVFGAIKDVMKFVGGGDGKKGDAVVMVTLENGWRQLGIVTRQEFGDLPEGLLGGRPNLIAVYLPFSYQLGGFTYFIDKSKCEPVPGMSVEDAMRYSVMAWMGMSEPQKEKE